MLLGIGACLLVGAVCLFVFEMNPRAAALITAVAVLVPSVLHHRLIGTRCPACETGKLLERKDPYALRWPLAPIVEECSSCGARFESGRRKDT